MTWWLWLNLAWGQTPQEPSAEEPAPEEAPTPEPAGEEPVPEEPTPDEEEAPVDVRAQTGPLDILEITVWGRLAVKQAEDDIVREMESMGYTTRRKNGKVVFKPPRAWMGKALLENGALTFRRPVAGVQPAPKEQYGYDPRRQGGAVDPSGRQTMLSEAGATVWVLPTRRKLNALRDEVRAGVADEIAWYQAVVARTAFEERIDALPGQLDLVWSDGVPLWGQPLLDTPDLRRNHILEYWATRSSTPEGQRVSGAVAAWLRAVVQESPHPITEEERATYEAQRPDVLKLP